MKNYCLSLGLVLAYHLSCSNFILAFRTHPAPSSLNRNLALSAIVALEPEPPGGLELQPIGTTVAENSRVKQLDDVVELPQSSSNGQPAFVFWMTTTADGKLIQEIRQTILKDASKKANFPGFRKGQVPPYAQPQITQFAIQESIIKTVEAMVSAYGLQSLSGSDGQVKVHEDVAEMTKGYKTGTSIPFTATLNAAYDESKIRQQPQMATSPVEISEINEFIADVVAIKDDTEDSVALSTDVLDAMVSDAGDAKDSDDFTKETVLTAED